MADKIATETIIESCNIKKGGEDLKFSSDFSSDQIERITCFVQGKEEVSMTIEPANKKLKIKSITKKVKIRNCNLKADSQDLKFEAINFTSDQVKQLTVFVREETKILITLERIQEDLPLNG